MILALLFAQAAAPATVPAPSDAGPAARFESCADLATSDPAAGERDASAWKLSNGGYLASQCLGLAYANGRKFSAASEAFEQAARGAEVAKDARAANYWVQAGNAWLAAGDFAKARSAMDAALASGGLKGLELGEAYLDRARIAVATNDTAAARLDLDRATLHAGDDPLVWLLSATLARRTGDVKRAQTDIAQALERASDDASVQLEAGNIAALAGDELGARGAWRKAAELAPGTPVGNSAQAALSQFEAGK